MGNNNSSLDSAIARATRHGFSVRQKLGGDPSFPFVLVSSPLALAGLVEVLDRIDDPAEATRANLRRIRELADDSPTGQAARALADEIESEPGISRVTPDAQDDALLHLGRAKAAVLAVQDSIMSGEVRDELSMIALALGEIDAADRALLPPRD